MFKSILKCSVFALFVLTVAACNQDDKDHRFNRGNGNEVNCYHHNGNVNCQRD